MAICLGTFSVTVIGGFLGLNLIRVVSDRVRAEIHREVSGQVEPLRLLDRGKLQMEERAYVEALETFRALAAHGRTLVPIVWQGRALKRLGRLSEAIDVLQGGLKGRGAADENFRRAVVLWNLACYRALVGTDVESVIEALAEALHLAPEFRRINGYRIIKGLATMRTSAKRRLTTIASLFLTTLASHAAFANYFCDGKVESVTVSPSGVVTVNSPDAGLRYQYLCIIGATENGVASDACKGILATLLSAANTGQHVQFGFNDSSSCGARLPWVWATGWYWGPMLVAN